MSPWKTLERRGFSTGRGWVDFCADRDGEEGSLFLSLGLGTLTRGVGRRSSPKVGPHKHKDLPSVNGLCRALDIEFHFGLGNSTTL
ncbi:hypothetical protein NPIL_506641 [Nephila pilipes]|uniref:Uncharacterized protein n=1 Tax=Nephila pilipes TaxID=299642 RepID=A0A8X6UH09_NEPPI|nr:hypothetical protein NPIL_506641 [Nephila pilipes]